MLMMVLRFCGMKRPKPLMITLVTIGIVMLGITTSPGILPIYYKEVSFKIVDGVSTLVKVYGPLHPLFLLYLLGYFAAMVTVIIRASVKKTIESATHAIILAIAVFVNIGVWFIEQLSDIDFEFLSVSYKSKARKRTLRRTSAEEASRASSSSSFFRNRSGR